MCGIVGAIAERHISPILLEGLRRLEYRGYDSAGMAVFNNTSKKIDRLRVLGKVVNLTNALEKHPLPGHLGIAHTRWATNGEPSEKNAHPHFSEQQVAVVHNGIIENHVALHQKLLGLGYQFESETDTEVIGHLIHYHLQQGHTHKQAIQLTLKELKGAYALGIIFSDKPDTLFGTRHGSPLVIGVGIGENFIASDQLALLPVTQRFMTLEEGDVAEITRHHIHIENAEQKATQREIKISSLNPDTASKGSFRHYMLKEIYEQPHSLNETLIDHLNADQIADACFGHKAAELLPTIKRVHIIACGTSFHAGLVAKYWLEALAGIPCQVDVASEFRYRPLVIEANTLFVALSQSGETADTLAALRKATGKGITLAICNVAQSSLVKEADLAFITRAGTEIGVAATKTFTAQLTALLLLTLALGKYHHLNKEPQALLINELKNIAELSNQFILLDGKIQTLAQQFIDSYQALFLGRGHYYPIALEGALKLKEISYIHAEAYPAGELKHGPLALVDSDMPIIVLAPNNELIEKLTSNMKEVEARGGRLFVFADNALDWSDFKNITVITMPSVSDALGPIVYTIPLQLLAYHVAVLKGTDVDQPRNLAKSVTVE